MNTYNTQNWLVMMTKYQIHLFQITQCHHRPKSVNSPSDTKQSKTRSKKQFFKLSLTKFIAREYRAQIFHLI